MSNHMILLLLLLIQQLLHWACLHNLVIGLNIEADDDVNGPKTVCAADPKRDSPGPIPLLSTLSPKTIPFSQGKKM